MWRKNSRRQAVSLGITRLEDRTVPAGNITVIVGGNGSGSLDGFMFDATPETVAPADGGSVPGTLSTGALAAISPTVDINAAAQTDITFSDLGGTLTLPTSSTNSVIFNASGGALSVTNAVNILATSGASLFLTAAAGLNVFDLNSSGGVTLTAGGAGNLVGRSILTGGIGSVLLEISSGGTGSILQSGSIVGGAVSFSGRGDVSADDVHGSIVSVSTKGGAVSSAGGNAIVST